MRNIYAESCGGELGGAGFAFAVFAASLHLGLAVASSWACSECGSWSLPSEAGFGLSDR